jgi:diguanylate cyclase (GGDEF)-like protein
MFLSRHIETLKLSSSQDIALYTKANQLLKRFNDSILTLDLDYIKREDYLLEDTRPKNEEYAATFNLHSDYLINNLPQFMLTTKYLLSNDLSEAIEDVRKSYEKIAINDLESLDIFASILFSVFLLSILLILVLVIKYFAENQKLLETKKSLEYSIAYDLLTNLLNRKSFTENLKAIRFPHVLLINIDNFKHVNDLYGDATGNKVIKSLATFLLEYFKNIEHENIYRVGGDEFAVLFEEIREDEALRLADDLQRKITEHTFSFQNLEINLSVSIASNNIRPILENADLALKRVKKDVTKNIIAYKEELNLKTNVRQNLQTIDIIKTAIKEKRVIPYFQPIVNLQTQKIEKYEALVRIKQTDGSVLTPFSFLETAKKTSYYLEITKIMLQKTIEIAREYPAYRFSVNLSMLDLLNSELTDTLINILQKDPDTASRIDIELVESEYIYDISLVKEFINKIHALGSLVLIDDFGSGYSNFAYFAHLDIDIVKIDGSIVQEENDTKKLHMIKSIYNFSKGLNLKCIGEFVETREIALSLKEIGVEYAQGYYFSQPLPLPLDYDEVDI